jgi:hypothetical protein
MTPNERTALTEIVSDVKALNAKIHELKREAKERADEAWDACGVKTKVVYQLAREAAWDDVKRTEQRQYEEALDECRAALGLLADTPLGEAAQTGFSPSEPLIRKDGSVKPGMNADGTPRKRGRPPGSKNKPKLVGGTDSQAPLDPPPPPVPDIPDVPAAA